MGDAANFSQGSLITLFDGTPETVVVLAVEVYLIKDWKVA